MGKLMLAIASACLYDLECETVGDYCSGLERFKWEDCSWLKKKGGRRK